MNEFDDVEARLRRYRPINPPASLRRRTLALVPGRPRSRGLWIALGVAATLLVMLHMAASWTYRRAARDVAAAQAAVQQTILETTVASLGGGDRARDEAERLLALEVAAQPGGGSR